MSSYWQKIKRISISVHSNLPTKQKRYGERQMLIILIFIFFGDAFKWGGLFGISEYNWIQGHFSDIGLTAQFTTAIYYLKGHIKKSLYFALFIPPLLFSLYEVFQYPHIDPVDIICYFSGSGIALLSLIGYKRWINRTKVH